MENSTSISELPIDQTQPSTSNMEMPESRQGSNSTQQHQIDVQLVPEQIPRSELKNVQIREDKNKIHTIDTTKKVAKTEIIGEKEKIIILATVMFFVFQDSKFKNYVLNILCQIFGTFLKTGMGNISKIGVVFYSLVFGLLLFIITKIVDVNSFNLSI